MGTMEITVWSQWQSGRVHGNITKQISKGNRSSGDGE